jgi:hypothetical protein
MPARNSHRVLELRLHMLWPPCKGIEKDEWMINICIRRGTIVCDIGTG